MSVLSLSPAFAQEGDAAIDDPAKVQIDSLLGLINPYTPDSVKARLYYEASLVTGNITERLMYGERSMSLCKDTDTTLIVRNAAVMAYCYFALDKRDVLMPFLNKHIQLAAKSHNLYELQKLYKLKAMYFEMLNTYDSVFICYNMALEVCIRMKDTSQMAGCYMNLGLNYATKKYYAEAESNYKKAVELDSIIGAELELAVVYYNLGQLYSVNDKKEYLRAKEYLTKAIAIFEDQNAVVIRYVIAQYLAYDVLASVYIKMAQSDGVARYADSCLYYNKKARDYFQNAGYTDYYCYMAMTYAEYLIYCKRYNEALRFLLDLEQQINQNFTDLLDMYYDKLRRVYYEIGDYKNAYDVFEKNVRTSQRLYNDTTMNQMADAKSRQAVLIEKLKLENAEQVHKAETSRLRIMITSLIVGLVLVLLLIFYVGMALRIRQNANKVLSEKNNEISAQKDIIMEQWHAVESANNKILRSINYAKRIQTAAISKTEDVRALFPDSFIYYRPRDIVSGDFYYAAKCGRYSVMITADCTGHGIPGAFLSMLGISAVKEYCVSEDDAAAPGTILDRMRSFIKSTLVSEKEAVVADGMEMTICCYDFENMELRYAAANQTAYLVRRGELIKLKGDRMPVGRYIMEKDHFQTFEEPLEKGDVIYSCSDGIQDQQGGDDDTPYGKKLQVNVLVDFLLDNSSKPMDIQCATLDAFITEWRNGRPQVDDMTLIGIRV